jgi:hypothetical protein
MQKLRTRAGSQMRAGITRIIMLISTVAMIAVAGGASLRGI